MRISRNTFSILKYAGSALLTVALLALAFRGTDVQKVAALTLEAKYGWIGLSIATLFASHAVRALRWRYLLDPIKKDVGLRNLFSGVMIGYMMNNVLPRAGEIARPYVVGKLEGFSKMAAFGTIVVERLIDIASFLLLVAVVPLVYDGPLYSTFPWLRTTGAVATIASATGFGVLTLMMARRDWTDRILDLVLRAVPRRFRQKIRDRAHFFLDGLLFVKRPGSLVMIFVLTVLIWLLYIVMTYCALFSFDLGRQLGISGALVLLAIQSIGVSIPTPGGTGGYHAFTSQALIRLFSVDAAVALSYATVTHAAQFLVVSAVGGYFFAKDNIRLSDAVTMGGEKGEG